MGTTTSKPSSPDRRSSSSRGRRHSPETTADRARKVVGDLQEEFKNSVKKLDDDHPAAQLIDSVCGSYGGYFDDDRPKQSASFYSEDISEDGSRTVSEDDATYEDRSTRGKDTKSVESSSYMSQSDYESEPRRSSSGRRKASSSFDTEDDSKVVPDPAATMLSKPLASSFAKRCYFTKSGIGKATQHYEGLTLTGNIVLMLAAAMKLKGCPTICDEDLRRVEQTYPNQFSRLPDELLLSSGWRRISKYCHFSSKAVPDGIPFFHSKQRLHPSGGYYFLLAAAVGMVRPIDVEPLTRDTLVLLETDFPTQCDQIADKLVADPDQWTLVDKFCFFSGGPINTEEDVYYQADFDGNPIYMLAFLSPSLTPEELYKLSDITDGEELGLKSVPAVLEVESVYDLTERDFDDLKLYHLGPCRALPQYILQPQAWAKVLPPHFLSARETALMRAQDYQVRIGGDMTPLAMLPPQGSDYDQGDDDQYYDEQQQQQQQQQWNEQQQQQQQDDPNNGMYPPPPPPDQFSPEQYHDNSHDQQRPGSSAAEYQRAIQEEGAFIDTDAPIDEAIASRFPLSPPGTTRGGNRVDPDAPRLDPPEDEPPSLNKRESLDGVSYDEEGSAFGGQEQDLYNDPTDPDDPMASPEPIQNDQFFNQQQQQQGGEYYETPDKQNGPGGEYYSPDQDYYETPAQGGQPGQEYYQEGDGAYQSPGGDQYTEDEQCGMDGQYEAERGSFSPPNDQYSPEDGHYPHPDDGQYYPEEDGQYDGHPDGQGHHDTPGGHYPMSPADDVYSTGDDHVFEEEKKVGGHLDRAAARGLQINTGEDDFVPIKRDGYTLGQQNGVPPAARSMTSPKSTGDQTSVSQSSALRGAQELLKRNRQRRMEMAMKTRARADPAPALEEYEEPDVIRVVPAVAPSSPKDDESAMTWESGSELTASVISGSSAWTDSSNQDRSSRRALILQMAKARMKTNKDPTSPGPTIEEENMSQEEEDVSRRGLLTETNPDIDFAEDLD